MGVLTRGDGDVSARSRNSEFIDARLRCSSKGFCFAIRDDGGDDIYIRDHQLNHAWNGDRVLVRITREGGRRRFSGRRCSMHFGAFHHITAWAG